ncbi:MAG: lytic transglycosylase domain-containing protein [Candidatus Aminicenantes bacterium]|nr:MAG: lytic transglycosylase domain-containing protein [Candidatus Aminicenantes bacterium]
MKRLKPLTLIALILCFIPSEAFAEIIVRQDKNGNLIITNEPLPSKESPRVYKRRTGGLTFVPSSPSLSKVPEKYLVKIRKLAGKYGLKESLIIAVARAESGFNPFAVSKKGAVGIMQLMQDTALKYGVVNRYNADQNLEAGVRHLKYLYVKYNRSIPLTLAAYNAGEEAVKKYKGVPPYKETRTFIKRVMKYMGMAYSNFFSPKITTKIYQYRTKDGRIMITDKYPSNAPGPVTVIE